MGYIYFAQSGEKVKIGFSESDEGVEQRIKAFRTSDPDYFLFAKIPGDKGLEKSLHNRFSELNIGGEVFLFGEEIKSYINGVNEYYYTTDLSQFEIDRDTNREISSNHVAKIKDSIRKVGVRRELPIIVKRRNKKLIVVDGQHRLKAVRELIDSKQYPHIGIWYIISDADWDHEITAITNDTQESWNLKEYFDLYVKQGKREYIELQAFMDRFDMIPLTVALALSLGTERTVSGFMAGNSDIGQLVKSGNFVFLDKQYANDMGRMISDVSQYFGNGGKMSRLAQSAFISFVNMDKRNENYESTNYDHDRMMDQLNKYSSFIQKQRTIDDWKRQMYEIYNRNRKKDVLLVVI